MRSLLWEVTPPFRPASLARPRFCEKERFSAGTLLPPLLAISRLFSTLIDAKPRLDVLIFRSPGPLEARGCSTEQGDEGSSLTTAPLVIDSAIFVS